MRHFGSDGTCVIARQGFTVGSRGRLCRELRGDFEVRKGPWAEPLIRLAGRLAGGLGVNFYGGPAKARKLACAFDDVIELGAENTKPPGTSGG